MYRYKTGEELISRKETLLLIKELIRTASEEKKRCKRNSSEWHRMDAVVLELKDLSQMVRGMECRAV
jgi:hypothetical protein